MTQKTHNTASYKALHYHGDGWPMFRLTDRDTQIKLPAGRNDQFTHYGSADPRNVPTPGEQSRDMFLSW
ncbi:hypothetical protein AGR1A_pAt20604 [Agrobacterium fabacearum CFBP 5771]|nr:hypothetical protein AGR1A_pAt20604 [Agrobacterium fabacearum CFBP 5771]